jgi:predicted acylesterase/phospholipase RssA
MSAPPTSPTDATDRPKVYREQKLDARGRRICDLVMKGGVTSGVLYPPAILELADRYHFRGIGGASAGAIAAAGTAAAELGRFDGEGFELLETVSQELARGDTLRRLFEPTPATRPLMELFLGYTDAERADLCAADEHCYGGHRRRFVRRLLARRLAPPFLAGLAASLALVAGLVWASGGLAVDLAGLLWHLLFGLGFAGLVGVVAAAWWTYRGLYRDGRRLLAALAEQHFGVCYGCSPERNGGALVDYLSERYDRMAGLWPDRGPLTFRHLRDGGIDLKLMTANLSLERPYIFPLEPAEALAFKDAELQPFFPEYVMRALRAGGRQRQANGPDVRLPEGYYFLPPAEDLPVIVATRISVSFPVLFSAVPLYTLSEEAFERVGRTGEPVREADLLRHYFSDGGIVSNFPIHVFDRWLPDCPTFGINLADLPPEAMSPAGGRDRGEAEGRVAGEDVDAAYLSRPQLAQGPADAGEMAAQRLKQPPGRRAVYLPRADAEDAPEWQRIEMGDDALGGLINLAKAIFYTAKNHRDNLQAGLPSYRERIVTVRLKANQGGMNMTMTPAEIQELQQLGREAGRALCSFDFDHHRWVRLLVIMAQLERELGQMAETFEADASFDGLLARPELDGFPFAAAHSPAWRSEARQLIRALREFLRGQPAYAGGKPFFDSAHTPTPQPVKRLVPRE